MKYVIVFVLGIVVGQVGVKGVVNIFDNGIAKTKELAVETSK
jgi:hypothetical protein